MSGAVQFPTKWMNPDGTGWAIHSGWPEYDGYFHIQYSMTISEVATPDGGVASDPDAGTGGTGASDAGDPIAVDSGDPGSSGEMSGGCSLPASGPHGSSGAPVLLVLAALWLRRRARRQPVLCG